MMFEDVLPFWARTLSPETRLFVSGQTVIQADVRGDSGFLVLRGRVRVLRHTSSGLPVSLAVFSTGDWFGIHSVDAHWYRAVTCRAVDDCELLVVRREQLPALMERHPEVDSFFDKSLEHHALLKLLGLTGLLAAVPDSHVAAAIDVLNERTFSAGTVIFREGDSADDMFVIRSGQVEISRLIDGKPKVIRPLNEGDFFGERALLERGCRTATATALNDTACFVLDHAGFNDLINRAPLLATLLEQRVDTYKASDLRSRLDGDSEVRLVSRSAADKELAGVTPMSYRAFGQLARLPEPFFAADAESVWQLLATSTVVRYRKGDLLMTSQGGQLHPLLVCSGSLRIVAPELIADAPSRSVRRGRIFRPTDAEIAGLTTFSVLASMDGDAIVFDEQVFARFQNRHTHVVASLLAAKDWSGDLRSSATAVGSRMIQHGSQSADRQISRGGLLKLWVRQRDEYECGVAALATACRALGMSATQKEIRRLTGMSETGLNMGQLQRAAELLGLKARARLLCFEDLNKYTLPALLHWEGGHWVVALKVAKNAVTLADPAIGIITMSRRMLKARWDGHVLMLSSRDEFNGSLFDSQMNEEHS
jgi:CRP-like cAMP-binding protein